VLRCIRGSNLDGGSPQGARRAWPDLQHLSPSDFRFLMPVLDRHSSLPGGRIPDGGYRITRPSPGQAGPDRPFTEADLCPNAIGVDPCVADQVRCVGYSDRAHAPLRMNVFRRLSPWLRDRAACARSVNPSV
jgi:hypothetical protein